MSFAAYGRVLREPGVAWLLFISLFARLPHAASGLIFSLHVVSTLEMDFLRAGLATTVLTVGIAVGAPWRGRVVDRKGLRRAIVPSIAVAAAGWCAVPYVSYGWLLPLCFVVGVYAVPAFAVVRQALAVLTAPEDRQTAYALDSIATEFTFIAGPIAGAYLVTAHSSALALLSVGIATVVSGALIMWLNPPTRAAQRLGSVHEAGAPAAPRQPLFTASVVAVLGATVAATFTLSGMELGIVAALKQWGAVGFTGVVFAVWSLGSAAGGLVYGAMRRSAHPLWVVLGLSLVTAPIALATGVTSLGALSFVAGLMCAPAIATVNGSLSKIVPEGRLGEALGWNGTALTLGGALGAPLCGVMIDSFGPPGGFLTAAVLGFVVAAAGLAVYRRRPG
ncbi:MAG: MFS transporter [Bifidobacteriaceae bacterium]|jgi:MFS family permease|nr:MFS transporter [Bifidobacteriaceae bacterium]